MFSIEGFGLGFWLVLLIAVGIIAAATKAAIRLAASRWTSPPEWHPRREVRWVRHLGYVLRIGYSVVLFLGAYITILGTIFFGALYVFDNRATSPSAWHWGTRARQQA